MKRVNISYSNIKQIVPKRCMLSFSNLERRDVDQEKRKTVMYIYTNKYTTQGKEKIAQNGSRYFNTEIRDIEQQHEL